MLTRKAAPMQFLALAFASLLAGSAGWAQEKKKDLELDKIPKKVMDTLKARFPEANIHKWTKEKEGDQEVYDIEFKQDKKKFEADIRDDGLLLDWEVEFPAEDLPKAVTNAVEARYPKSKMKEIMKITKVEGQKETLHGFEIIVTTADNREIEVTVAPDGKVLEDGGAKKEEKKK
jgi:hypothetical protein